MNSVNEKYDAMILRYLDGQCSQDEVLMLLSWVAESEENRLYFKSFTDVWSLTDFNLDDDTIDELSCQFPITVDYDGVGMKGSKFAFYL